MESMAAFELWIGLLACGGFEKKKIDLKLSFKVIANAFVFFGVLFRGGYGRHQSNDRTVPEISER